MASIEPEQVLAGIAATSRDCLVCTDLADVVTWAGPAVEEVLGWTPRGPRRPAVRRAAPGRELGGAGPPVRRGARGRGQRAVRGRAPAPRRCPRRDDGHPRPAARRRRHRRGAGPHPAGPDRSRAAPRSRASPPSSTSSRRWRGGRGTPPSSSTSSSGCATPPRRWPRCWAGARTSSRARRCGRPSTPTTWPTPARWWSGSPPWPTTPSATWSGCASRAGGWRWIEQTLTNCLADPEIGGIVATLRDLTDQVETGPALRFSEALHRAIVETAQEGILATAPDGSTMLANEKLGEILGLPVGEPGPPRRARAARPPARVEAAADPLEAARAPERYEADYRHPDGRERVLQVTRSLLHHPGGPETLGWLSLVSDVTEARRVEDELRRRALHDPLTSLPNRYLGARPAQDGGRPPAAQPRRHHRRALPRPRRLQADQRQPRPRGRRRAADRGGLPAHLGGAHQRHGGADRRRRVRGHLRERRRGRGPGRAPTGCTRRWRSRCGSRTGESLPVSVSIGVALSPPHAVADLLRFADAAMYDAKQLGPGRTEVAAGPGEWDQDPRYPTVTPRRRRRPAGPQPVARWAAGPAPKGCTNARLATASSGEIAADHSQPWPVVQPEPLEQLGLLERSRRPRPPP